MFIGVDFGTTMSQAATINFGRMFPLLREGVYGVESLFYYDCAQGPIVGREAGDAGQGKYAQNLVRDVKMNLDKTFNLDGRDYAPAEIIREIYKNVIMEAQETAENNSIEKTIEGIVLSHPAKFNVQECNLIRNAAAFCMPDGTELKITGMIKEPVAAALSYYHLNPLANGTPILVYDLGGGTCDIALVVSDTTTKQSFKVIDSSMVRRGGRDWDKVLMDYAIEKFELEANGSIDIRSNAGYMEKVRRAVIEAKHALSTSVYTQIRAEFNGEMSRTSISREVFEELTASLLDETLDELEAVYNRNADKTANVFEIICVGGASHMPQVREGIQSRFPNCTVKVSQPAYAVVNGTAIYASLLGSEAETEVETPVVQDILPFSYGIRCKKKDEFVIQNILIKGSKYPACLESDKFRIQGCGSDVNIEIYESECSEDVFSCNSGKGEKPVGSILFKMPSGAKENDKVFCTLSTPDMSVINVKARNERGEHVETSFTLDSIK